MNTNNMVKKIREWVKDHKNEFPYASVKVSNGIIVIDNVGWNDAATIASLATGKTFEYMGASMTRPKS